MVAYIVIAASHTVLSFFKFRHSARRCNQAVPLMLAGIAGDGVHPCFFIVT